MCIIIKVSRCLTLEISINKIRAGIAIAGVWIGAAVMTFSPAAAGQVVYITVFATAATGIVGLCL